MFAIVVQSLLPFVLAGAIGAAAAAAPICHAGSDAGHRGGQPNPSPACPICTALAATVAVTTPTPPTLPLPQTSSSPAGPPVAHVSAETSRPASYRSRAPPLA